jgi:hypothetical protein
MNAVELTEVQTNDIEPSSTKGLDTTQRSAPGILNDARLRYALIAVVAVLAVWLTLTVRRSLREIDAQVEMIHSNIVGPRRPH